MNFDSVVRNLLGERTSSLNLSRKKNSHQGRKTRNYAFVSEDHLKAQVHGYSLESLNNEANREIPSSLLSTGQNKLKDASPSLVHSSIVSKSSTGELVHPYQPMNSMLNTVSRLCDPGAESRQDYRTLPHNGLGINVMSKRSERYPRKRNLSVPGNPTGSSIPTRQTNTSSHFLDSANQSEASKEAASSQVGDAQRSIAISETSVLESKSGDDVLGMIDLKLFLEFKRTMMHQQRIFAAQIFELHRLIKVQRLIARSPDLFASQHKHYFSKQPLKDSRVEKKSQSSSEPLSLPVKGNFYPKTHKMSTDRRQGNACFNLHPLKHDYLGHHSLMFLPEPCSEALQSTSESKPGPCTVNQWLIPISSPSEGLVYKPYVGPCPPPTGSIAPVYWSPSSVDGVFMNMTFGVPTSNELNNGFCTSLYALGQSLQTYALPVAGTPNPSSGVEQNNPFGQTWQCGLIQFSSSQGNNCGAIPDQNSCNAVSRNNLSSSNSFSSPCEKVQSVLSLFPTTPNIQASNHPVLSNIDEQQPIHVIKAVPRIPKLASESTARILKSIQDERKCC